MGLTASYPSSALCDRGGQVPQPPFYRGENRAAKGLRDSGLAGSLKINTANPGSGVRLLITVLLIPGLGVPLLTANLPTEALGVETGR